MKRKYHCLSNSSNNNNKYLREKRIDILYIHTIIYCEKSLFSNENHAHISLKRKKKEREKIIHICTNKLCTAINNRNSFHLKDYYFSSKDREDCLNKIYHCLVDEKKTYGSFVTNQIFSNFPRAMSLIVMFAHTL